MLVWAQNKIIWYGYTGGEKNVLCCKLYIRAARCGRGPSRRVTAVVYNNNSNNNNMSVNDAGGNVHVKLYSCPPVLTITETRILFYFSSVRKRRERHSEIGVQAKAAAMSWIILLF